MQLTVAISGLDSLSLGVKYLTTAAALGLKLGVQEAAGMIETEAKAIVPVDTGRLRDSIHTEVKIDQAEQQERTVSPDTPYAGFVEFGTYRQSAQPYMRPAFDSQQEAAKQAIKDSLNTEIDAAMSRVAAGRR